MKSFDSFKLHLPQLKPHHFFLPVLLIALLLRLYKFTETYGFFGDQGQDLLAINYWFTTGEIPVVGILTSLSTFHMGPMYYYSIAPLVWLFQGDPIGPVVLFLLGGVGLVALGFYLCLKFVDLPTAIIFSLLLTFSPHLIFLSKGAYSPNLQPLMTLALIYFFLNFIKERKWISIFFLFLIIGVGVQFHYLFLANLLIFSLLFLIFKKGVYLNWRFYTLSLIGFIIPLVPFFLGQIGQGFQDINGIYLYLTEPSEKVKSVITLQTITDKLVFPFSIYFSNEKIPWYIEKLITPFFIIIVAFSVFLSARKNKMGYILRVVLVYFLVGVLISIIGRLNFFWWYQGFFSVTIFLLISCLISYLLTMSKLRVIGLTGILLFLIWEVSLLPNAYQIGRLPKLIFETDELIRNDLRTQDKSRIGILLNTSISQSQGFDYRYILEKDGIKTYSANNISNTDYIIVEKEEISEKVIIPDELQNQVKSIGEISVSGGTLVKSAEVFRVNLD